AMLVAVNVVFSRFTMINITQSTKFSFEVIAIAFAAYVYGMGGAVIVAGLGDFVGALVKPFGPYNPAYTVTAIITGLIFAIFLYKKLNIGRIIASVLTTQVLCSMLLNTFWNALFYGTKGTLWQSFVAMLSTRLTQFAIMTPLKIVLLILLVPVFKQAEKMIKR
ncbi:MAG: folate family ECF transporter S component, partial [Clostridia bacterium]|nr:folate family ECF transporter S component [Clostridia bacterium]